MNEKETYRASVEKPSPLFIHVTGIDGVKYWLRVDDLRAIGPDSTPMATGHSSGLTHCSFFTGGDHWIKETPEQILDTIKRMLDWNQMYDEPAESQRLSGSSSEPKTTHTDDDKPVEVAVAPCPKCKAKGVGRGDASYYECGSIWADGRFVQSDECYKRAERN